MLQPVVLVPNDRDWLLSFITIFDEIRFTDEPVQRPYPIGRITIELPLLGKLTVSYSRRDNTCMVFRGDDVIVEAFNADEFHTRKQLVEQAKAKITEQVELQLVTKDQVA